MDYREMVEETPLYTLRKMVLRQFLGFQLYLMCVCSRVSRAAGESCVDRAWRPDITARATRSTRRGRAWVVRPSQRCSGADARGDGVAL